MALMTVYDTEGVAHQKEPVDVKECVEHLGWTKEPKPEVVVEVVEEPKPEVKNFHGKR